MGTEAHPKFNLRGVKGNQDSGDQVGVARKQNKGEFNEKENAHQEILSRAKGCPYETNMQV